MKIWFMECLFPRIRRVLFFIGVLWLSACAQTPGEAGLFTDAQSGSRQILHQQAGQVYYTTSSNTQETLDLWRLDTRTQQIHHLRHFIDPAKFGVVIDKPLWFNNHLYFRRSAAVPALLHDEVWRTDGRSTGTQRIYTLPVVNGEYPYSPELMVFADRLYLFELDGGAIPAAVRQTDGGASHLQPVIQAQHDLFAGSDWGSAWSFPGDGRPFMIHNNKLIFITYKPDTRERLHLWAIEARQPGKAVLLGEFGDIMVRPAATGEDSGLLWFMDGEMRWRTDGTKAGTQRQISGIGGQ